MARFSAFGAVRIGVTVAAALTVASAALAQSADSAVASRVSFAGGFGGGTLTQRCGFPACPVPFSGERTWMARLGYRDGQVIVGVEYDHWSRSLNANGVQFSTTYTWVGPSLQWFPFETAPLKGLYVRGLVARATLDAQPGGPHALTGLGYGAGIGFDVPIVHGVVLTPYGDMLGADRAELSARTIGRDGRPIATKNWYSAVLKTFGVALRVSGIP